MIASGLKAIPHESILLFTQILQRFNGEQVVALHIADGALLVLSYPDCSAPPRVLRCASLLVELFGISEQLLLL